MKNTVKKKAAGRKKKPTRASFMRRVGRLIRAANNVPMYSVDTGRCIRCDEPRWGNEGCWGCRLVRASRSANKAFYELGGWSPNKKKGRAKR